MSAPSDRHRACTSATLLTTLSLWGRLSGLHQSRANSLSRMHAQKRNLIMINSEAGRIDDKSHLLAHAVKAMTTITSPADCGGCKLWHRQRAGGRGDNRLRLRQHVCKPLRDKMVAFLWKEPVSCLHACSARCQHLGARTRSSAHSVAG